MKLNCQTNERDVLQIKKGRKNVVFSIQYGHECKNDRVVSKVTPDLARSIGEHIKDDLIYEPVRFKPIELHPRHSGDIEVWLGCKYIVLSPSDTRRFGKAMLKWARQLATVQP